MSPKLRVWLLRSLLLLISLAISWMLFEYFGTKILQAGVKRDYSPTVDHWPLPNHRGFNEDGVRTYKRLPVSSFGADSYNIIFLGDSFTMGYRAENGHNKVAFPFQLNALLEEHGATPPVHVVNFGWTSSSPLLSYRRLMKIGAKYHPRLVILCVDIGDFDDDLRYRRLLEIKNPFSPTRFLLRKSGLITYYQRAAGFLGVQNQREGYFYIVNEPLKESEKYTGEIEKNIRSINQYCKEYLHAHFILILLPRYIEYNKNECPRDFNKAAYTPMGPYVFEPFKWLEKYKKKVDFPAYSLLEDFQHSGVFPTCYADDAHWNPAGHRIAGFGIFKIIEKLVQQGYLQLHLRSMQTKYNDS